MVVVDSSFLIAWHNTRDVHHAASVPVMEKLLSGDWGRGLLLEYVFLEVVTVVGARRGLQLAVGVATALLEARELDFLPCSELFADALETFRSHSEAKLSFTDAAIVAAARLRGADLVATFDNDFRGLRGITVAPG